LNAVSKPAQEIAKPIDARPKQATLSVFSCQRAIKAANIPLPEGLEFDAPIKMDGLKFLAKLPADKIPVAFFDPQYRGVLDKLSYGNEGKSRGKARAALAQMDDSKITQFVRAIDKALMPSGHLFLWIDKFHLCTGFSAWLADSQLEVVDMITWDKGSIGMGYRTRRKSEYLVVLQKHPRKAKGVWTLHTIPDVWCEAVKRNGHAHNKPVALQGELIAAVSNPGDIVIDPAAGSFSVMEACYRHGRHFLGCDIKG